MASAIPSQPVLPPVVGSQGAPLRDEDRRALGKLKVFSILFLVNIVAGFVIGFGANLLTLTSALQSGTAGTAGAPSAGSLEGILTVVAASALVSGVIGLAALWVLRSGFRLLSQVDAPLFSAPAKFTLVAIVGFPLLYAALAFVLYGVFVALPGAGPGVIASSRLLSSGALAYILGGGVLGLIGLVLVVVGTIGGPMLGLWRVGSRYDADTIRAGAIIYIIPLIQIAAPVLVLVGVSNVSMNLEATGRAQG